MATTQDLAQALKYGPQTAGLVRRSAYLEDALRSLQATGGQNIHSPWELGTKLLATALLSRASNKANDATLSAVKQDKQDRIARLLAGLGDDPEPTPTPAPTPAPQPPTQSIAPPPIPVQQAPLPPAQPAPAAFQASPQGRDALIRMVVTEAGGEGPEGMAAAAHVAMNRARTNHGGASSLSQVVNAPHQFEGMSRAGQVKPDDYARAAQVVDGVLGGQLPDPTGGAVNFLNPELQTQLGRPIPTWAQGHGHRIGRHVFFGGQPGGQAQPMQVAQTVPPPPIPPNPQGPPDQPAFQLAANGPIQPGMIPSAPAASPVVGAEAPPVASPQAAAGGNARSDPFAARKVLVRRLMSSADPEDQAHGEAEYWKLMGDMAKPTKWDIKVQDGYVIATDPENPQNRHVQRIDELQTRDVAAAPGMPAGALVQQDAKGGKSVVYQPPTGYQAGPNGSLQAQTGGPADPMRPQAPPQGYGYASGGTQAPIQGGPADLKSLPNVMEGANRYGGMIKTIVDGAMKVKQNYGAVQTGYRQQNGTGDIAMTNGLQKLIDEGVVKGEDVNMQMKSNGLQGTLGSWAQYAKSGGIFEPAVRDKILKTATDLYGNLDQTYRARVTSLQPGFDEAYGQGSFGKYVFPEAFATELGWNGQGAARAQSGAAAIEFPAAVNQTHQKMVQAGQYDAKAPLGSPKRPFLARSKQEAAALDRPENRGKHVVMPDGSIGIID